MGVKQLSFLTLSPKRKTGNVGLLWQAGGDGALASLPEAVEALKHKSRPKPALVEVSKRVLVKTRGHRASISMAPIGRTCPESMRRC